MPESLAPEVGGSATISIVIEWENALNSEADRAVDMLRQVSRQIAEYSESNPSSIFETLLVYNSEVFAERDLANFIDSALAPPGRRLNYRLLELPGGGYYSSKGHGVHEATSDIVLFMDSDTIPGKGWLNTLLEAINRPDVNMVAGATYIDHRNLLGKAFAVNWFFPLRPDGGSLVRTKWFSVNNMAVRRSFYLKHPFPEVPGTSRGSCVVLGDRLAALKIPVHMAPAALASHPAPNGVGHLVPRALAQGRDRVIRERFLGHRWQQSWLAGCIRLPRHLLGVVWKTIRFGRQVELSLWQSPAAIAIAWFYFFLYWLGEMGEHLGLKRIRAIRV